MNLFSEKWQMLGRCQGRQPAEGTQDGGRDVVDGNRAIYFTDIFADLGVNSMKRTNASTVGDERCSVE